MTHVDDRIEELLKGVVGLLVARDESWRTRMEAVHDMVESRTDFTSAKANYAADLAGVEHSELMHAKTELASQQAVTAARRDNEVAYDAERRREHNEWVETVQVGLESKTKTDLQIDDTMLESAQLGTKVAAVSTHFFPEGDTGL